MAMVAPAAYPSMPSSPTGGLAGFSNHFEYYFYTSAPTSPSQRSCSSLSFPWDQEEAHGGGATAEEFEFTFGFSQQFKNERPPPVLADADELFEGGRIRPLNHPSRRQSSSSFSSSPPRPVIEGRGRGGEEPKKGAEAARERGRTLSSLLAAPSRSRRGTRSLSPMRGAGSEDLCKSPPPSSTTTSLLSSHGSKKYWKLKDLFLFRSASEGRAAGGRSKDPLLKYSLLSSSSSPQNLKNDGNGLSKRRGPVAAAAASLHEAHYTANRAAAEELKKRTPLPFHRHSLFGYLRSNAAIHSISRRFSGYSNRRAA